MAATEYGVNDALAVKLWAKKLAVEALKTTYLSRFTGTSEDSLILKRTDLEKSAGDKITYGLRMQLTSNGKVGDALLEGNEEQLTTYSDSILINQSRNAVRSGGKMSEQRVSHSVRDHAKAGLRDWMADIMDASFFNHICGYTPAADGSDGAENRYGHNTITAPSTNRIYINESGSTTDEDLDSNDTFVLGAIDNAVYKAKTASPLIRPVKVMRGSSPGEGMAEPGGEYYGDYFVMFLHPAQVRDMRTSTSTGQWLDIQKAALQGGKESNNPIFTGALGCYNGVILHESHRVTQGVNSTTGAAITTVRRAVLCGAQAGTIAFGQASGGVNSVKWVEKSFDYGNQLGVSASNIWGLTKNTYNSEDFGTVVVSTYAA